MGGELAEVVDLIKNTLVPQIKAMGDDVKEMSSKIQFVMIGHERHQGKIDVLEEKVGKLKCEDNLHILHSLAARTARLEASQEAGHTLNEDCKAKNEKVDKALLLAEANKKKNEEQEGRHKRAAKEQKERAEKLINRLWILIIAIIGAAATAVFTNWDKFKIIN